MSKNKKYSKKLKATAVREYLTDKKSAKKWNNIRITTRKYDKGA